MLVTDTSSLVSKIASLQNQKEYAELNWSGTFEDYLAIVRKVPGVTRTAFQRVYDMLLSYGQEEYIDNKKRIIRSGSSCIGQRKWLCPPAMCSRPAGRFHSKV